MPLGNIFTVLSACKFPSAFCVERGGNTPNAGKIKKFHMLCNIGKGGSCIHSAPAARPSFFLLLENARTHGSTAQLTAFFSLLLVPTILLCSPSLDSLSSPAAAVPPRRALPSGVAASCRSNWNLSLRLHITNPGRGREGSDGGVRGRRGVQVLGGAVAGRAGPHLPQPSAPGGPHRRAAGVQVLGAGGRRPLLLAGDRHRGVEPAAEQAGADRPHGRAARRPQRRLVPPHQRLRAALRPAPLVHRRTLASSSSPGDPTERDQRLRGGDRGAAAVERHLPRHQQLHQDRRPRPGGVRQALQVAGGSPARDAPDRPGGQGVPARRGPRHRPQHAQAPAPGDGVHADPDGGGGGDPGAVPRPQVPGPARVLGRGRQAPAGAPPGAPRPGPARRGLLREHLLGGVLRLLGRRRLHLLVGVHGRRGRLLRRRQRRRGHLGRRPGAREPRGQVLRRRVQRELRRLRLATVAVR